jgi:hypothetical protein
MLTPVSFFLFGLKYSRKSRHPELDELDVADWPPVITTQRNRNRATCDVVPWAFRVQNAQCLVLISTSNKRGS